MKLRIFSSLCQRRCAQRREASAAGTIQYLTKDEFRETAMRLGGGHWKNFEHRWIYHKAAIDFVRLSMPVEPGNVLEMGTMGVSLVRNSHTIDYAEKWNYKGFSPTYLHDARNIPWPIATKRYKTFVALRVFHHLFPTQKQCFLEAARIAENIILVVPESYSVPSYDTSLGIKEEKFTEWNNGTPPSVTVNFSNWIGNLYYWNQDSLHFHKAD